MTNLTFEKTTWGNDPLVMADWLWSDPDMLDFVLSRYKEPHRHYHDISHIRWLIRLAVDLDYHHWGGDGMWPTLSAMIVFHDIVYDPTAPSGRNETDSAILARLRLEDYPGMDVDLVCKGILATHTHHSDDVFIQSFLDLDMAILSARPSDYHKYAKNVRREYSHVPLEKYVDGRMNFLGSQLDREIIYFCETFRASGNMARLRMSTEQAHNNIAAEMGYLRHIPRRYLDE
jgi:predicted metal-dependent HD superfamily phosphohydrolase